MNTSSPFGPLQDQRDTDHLNLLSIFHFITAGLSTLGFGFLILHYLIMSTVMSGAIGNMPNSGPPPPAEIMTIMKVFYVILGTVLGLAILVNVLSGVFLRQRKHRVFSIIVASINCLQIPLGTTLGVFTLIVLLRESVRQSYERAGVGN